MLPLLGSRRLPRPRGQLPHAAGWPLAGLGKNILEVVSEIDIQAPAGFHYGCDRRDLGTSFRTAHVQQVLCGQAPVAESRLRTSYYRFLSGRRTNTLPGGSLLQGVITGLGQFAAWVDLLANLDQPVFQRGHDRNALGLSRGQSSLWAELFFAGTKQAQPD